jgi:hypothetical protein
VFVGVAHEANELADLDLCTEAVVHFALERVCVGFARLDPAVRKLPHERQYDRRTALGDEVSPLGLEDGGDDANGSSRAHRCTQPTTTAGAQTATRNSCCPISSTSPVRTSASLVMRTNVPLELPRSVRKRCAPSHESQMGPRSSDRARPYSAFCQLRGLAAALPSPSALRDLHAPRNGRRARA